MTVYIKNVPREAATERITLFGLLEHEHKKTVLHFTVQRNTEYNESVKSKVCSPLSSTNELILNPIRTRILSFSYQVLVA